MQWSYVFFMCLLLIVQTQTTPLEQIFQTGPEIHKQNCVTCLIEGHNQCPAYQELIREQQPQQPALPQAMDTGSGSVESSLAPTATPQEKECQLCFWFGTEGCYIHKHLTKEQQPKSTSGTGFSNVPANILAATTATTTTAAQKDDYCGLCEAFDYCPRHKPFGKKPTAEPSDRSRKRTLEQRDQPSSVTLTGSVPSSAADRPLNPVPSTGEVTPMSIVPTTDAVTPTNLVPSTDAAILTETASAVGAITPRQPTATVPSTGAVTPTDAASAVQATTPTGPLQPSTDVPHTTTLQPTATVPSTDAAIPSDAASGAITPPGPVQPPTDIQPVATVPSTDAAIPSDAASDLSPLQPTTDVQFPATDEPTRTIPSSSSQQPDQSSAELGRSSAELGSASADRGQASDQLGQTSTELGSASAEPGQHLVPNEHHHIVLPLEVRRQGRSHCAECDKSAGRYCPGCIGKPTLCGPCYDRIHRDIAPNDNPHQFVHTQERKPDKRNRYVERQCEDCKAKGKDVRTVHYCSGCDGNPFLCWKCYEEKHGIQPAPIIVNPGPNPSSSAGPLVTLDNQPAVTLTNQQLVNRNYDPKVHQFVIRAAKGGKTKGGTKCRGCLLKHQIENYTLRFCPACKGKPPLCKACFIEIHHLTVPDASDLNHKFLATELKMANNERVKKHCQKCSDNGKMKYTTRYCNECERKPFLCSMCFDKIHNPTTLTLMGPTGGPISLIGADMYNAAELETEEPDDQPEEPSLEAAPLPLVPLVPYDPPKASRTHEYLKTEMRRANGNLVSRPCHVCYERNKSLGLGSKNAQDASPYSSKTCRICYPTALLCPKCFNEIHTLD